jgi:hypothetical protein
MWRLGGVALAIALAATLALLPASAAATYKGRNGLIYIPFSDNSDQDTRVQSLPRRDGFLEVATPGREPAVRPMCSAQNPPPCVPRGLTFAPGGRLVAGFGPDGLTVSDRDGRDPRALLRHAEAPSWSPDGRFLAVFDAGDIFVIGRDGTGLRRLTRFNVEGDRSGFETRNAGEPAWSRANRIAFVKVRSTSVKSPAADILSVDPDTRSVRTLIRIREAISLDWSPDGRRLLFVSGGYVHTVDAGGRGHRRLRLRARLAIWSPDGRFIAAIDQRSSADNGSFVIARADGSRRRRYGLRESVTRFNAEAETRGIGGPVWSPLP